ncbi:MAG: hypothetical protein ABIH66_10680 [bacterium]
MNRVERYSIHEIAKRLDVSRNTIGNVLRTEREAEAVYERKSAYSPKLGPFEGKLKEILEQEESRPPRERQNATLLYEELQGHGYTGAVDSVRRFVKRWRAERGKTCVRGVRAAHLRAGQCCAVRLEHGAGGDCRCAHGSESGAGAIVPQPDVSCAGVPV